MTQNAHLKTKAENLGTLLWNLRTFVKIAYCFNHTY